MSTFNPSHIDVDVVVNGRSLSKIRHQDRAYVVADKGAKWVLRVRNRTRRRILVVATVDGLSVMDGKEGSYSSPGYILEGYSKIDIPGFRLNDSEVAAFRFGGKEGSYAARMGKPTNVGVIGVAAFEEVPPPPPPPVVVHEHHYHPYPAFPATWTRGQWENDNTLYCAKDIGGSCCRGMSAGPELSVNSCFLGDSGPVEREYSPPVEQEVKTKGGIVQNVGTSFGEKESHSVVRASFERQSSPAETVDLFYDDYEGLASKGVLVLGTSPKAFPGTGCQPPAGWRG